MIVPGNRLAIACGLLAAAVWLGPSEGRADDRVQQAVGGTPAGSSPEEVELFERRIRPLLVNHCHKCHGPVTQEGGLRLDSRQAVLEGGDTGPAVVPREPDESYLMDAVSYGDLYQMPPDGKLPDEAIADLRRWVETGAPWPEDATAEAAAAGPAQQPEFDLAQRAKHWSLQPLAKCLPPAIAARTPDWPQSPIDDFILAGLEAAGLAPAPPADKRTLLRRVTYDLVGLPPTEAELRDFLGDDSPDAYARVVDRLLASPHYGERWGRYWLDLVRYAETAGHEFDVDLPGAYLYRDYVIRALNQDLPYDQFVVEHVAGDLLAEPRRHPTERFNESILATGFWHLGESKHSPVDVREDEAARVDNQIDVFSKTFLALGVSCARCHDHKFDAITTRDYYALAGYLQSSRYQLGFIDDEQPTARMVDQLRLLDAQHADTLRAATAEQLSARVECLDARPSALTEGPTATSAATGADAGEAQAQWLANARQQPADLLYPLARLAAREVSPSAQFSHVREELKTQLEHLSGAYDDWLRTVRPFADFHHDFDGWFVTGLAFGVGPTRAIETVFAADALRPVKHLVEPGVAHSGLVSGQLQGTLRSPTFTIESSYIGYRMAGRQVQVRLIIDGLQQIRPPIYGGLEIKLDSDDLAFHAQDVSMWIGHRAYIEVLDLGTGYAAIDRVVFADVPPPAPCPNRLVVEMLDDPELASVSDLAGAYRRLFADSIDTWRGGETAVAEAADRGAILNWLLKAEWFDQPGFDAHTGQPQQQIGFGEFARQRSTLEAAIPAPRLALAMADGTPENERVFIRGNHKTLGPEVPRRFLEVFESRIPAPPPAAEASLTEAALLASSRSGFSPIAAQSLIAGADRSGRLELARRMIDPQACPLLPRVVVNRLWQHHFGLGLVATPDDFGSRGDPPTHSQLLDYLAGRFIDSGWSLKRMHRLMLLSSAYQMSSRPGAQAAAVDPENKLLHSMRPRRLEAEAIRDAMLAVSGRLDRALYGPSVPPHLTPFMSGRGRPAESGPLDGNGRRSIYINVRRNFLTPMFLAFDYPQPFTTIGRRSQSNVPAQALALLNNPLVVEQARAWSQRVAQDEPELQARIGRMYQQAFGRLPTGPEMEAALSFIAGQARFQNDDRAWADLAHVLFNAKEFIFLE